MDDFRSGFWDGGQTAEFRAVGDEQRAVASWLSRSLAATYEYLPGDALPPELLDLLPQD